MPLSDILLNDAVQGVPNSIALLGGGGKTTFQSKLAHEMSRQFERILVTSLTKSAFHDEFPLYIIEDQTDYSLESCFGLHNPISVMGRRINAEKLAGVSEFQLAQLIPQAKMTIVECDGSRNLPLKVHLPHDPVVPGFVSQVMVLVGTEAVNARLSDGYIHRPEVFSDFWEIGEESELTVDFISRVVTSKKGYSSKIPDAIPRTYFVNKADLNLTNAISLAEAIADKTDSNVWYGSLANDDYHKI